MDPKAETQIVELQRMDVITKRRQGLARLRESEKRPGWALVNDTDCGRFVVVIPID
jgi:hypothetical protein